MKASLINWLISLILLVGGIVALLAIHQNVYKPMVEENEKLKNDIKLLEVSLATQQGYKKEEALYKEQTETLNKQASEALSSFPRDLWEEDHIAYVDYIYEKTGMNITSLNWGQNGVVQSLSNGMALNAEMITFNYNRSYASLKDLITFLVNDSENHSSLTTLTISYNAQQDQMNGTMYVMRYYLTGQEGEHIPAGPNVDIETGQDNILD